MGWLRGPVTNMPGLRIEDEWFEAEDTSGRSCWRSVRTGELSPPGITKPDTWLEVVDKRTGLIYYWCRRTGDTSQLGEPRPGLYGARPVLAEPPDQLLSKKAGSGGKGGKGVKGAEPSLLAMYKNPLMYCIMGITAFSACYELYHQFSTS